MSRRRALLAACATVVLHLGAVPALTASTRDPDPDATFEFVPRLDTGLDFVQRSGTERQQYILEVKSTGVALLDFDRDGLLDICLTAGSTIEKQRAGEPGFGVRLYRNLGELRFADVTAQSGLGEFGWACGAAAADVDGNGWVDLLVTAYGPDRLFLNDAGHFTEVTDRAGLDRDGWSTSAAFADLDGDDDLDLFVARYLDFDLDHPPTHGEGFSCLWKEQVVMCGPRGLPAESDRLYRNRGDGTFEDVTEAWGIAAATPQYGLGVVIADFVGDSRPDIFVANDSSPNHLWENRGGRFEEVGFVAGVAYSADGQDQAGMGVGVADFDANGRWDLAVTNFADERNNLYLNQGDGTFFDEADRLRLGPAGQSALSWGIGCHDFDLDGRLDIFVANGHVYPQADHVKGTPGYAQKDHLFLGGPTGFDEILSERTDVKRVSRGAAFGDLDNDGDVDVVVSHLNDTPVIYECRAPKRHRSLSLRLEQPGKNRDALGARVIVRTPDRVHRRLVQRCGSFQASNDPRVHFGLGEFRGPLSVEVDWPDGAHETYAIEATERSRTLARTVAPSDERRRPPESDRTPPGKKSDGEAGGATSGGTDR